MTRIAAFRVYDNVAQSIDDHGKLLATSVYYRRSMAQRQNPNAFATSLTGVYATDPSYGTKLISLMQRYDLYRYDSATSAARHTTRRPGAVVDGVARHLPADSPGPNIDAPRHLPAGDPQPSTHPNGHPGNAQRGARADVSTATGDPERSDYADIPWASGRTPSGHRSGSHGPTALGRRVTHVSGQPAGRSAGGATAAPAASGRATPAVLPQSAPGGAMTPPANAGPGGADIPGLTQPAAQPAHAPQSASTPGAPPETSGQSAAYLSGSHPTSSVQTLAARRAPAAGCQTRRITTRTARTSPARYEQHIPQSVKNGFVATAKVPLLRAEPLYRDIASHTGIRWELLAACDWMQCKAQPRYSPVHGEKLGTINPDGTTYRTKSEALDQCADDLVGLAQAVYRIDLTKPDPLSVRELANVFAAFRWGGLLALHRTSAMEFPYSVAGLTVQHLNMRWPNIAEPNAPDKPGGRFRMPSGLYRSSWA